MEKTNLKEYRQKIKDYGLTELEVSQLAGYISKHAFQCSSAKNRWRSLILAIIKRVEVAHKSTGRTNKD